MKKNQQKKNKNRRELNPYSNLVNKAKISKSVAHSEINKARLSVKTAELFRLFPQIFTNRDSIHLIYGNQFPKHVTELYSALQLRPTLDPTSEVVWAISRCLMFSEEIKKFINYKELYENYFLTDSKTNCQKILSKIQDEFGISLWIYENRLSFTYHYEGIEEARKLCKYLVDNNSPLAHTVLNFIRQRIEATGIKNELKNDVENFIADVPPIFQSYIKSKILEQADIDTNAVSSTLFIEGFCSIIDLYETLVFILQRASINRYIEGEILDIIKKPLLVLYDNTQDRRLKNVLYGLGIWVHINEAFDLKRVEIIEEYSKGNYTNVCKLSKDYLERNHTDIPVHILQIKSSIPTEFNIEYPPGILSESLIKIKNIFLKDSEPYRLALEIFTLSDRYNSHSWVHYLAAITKIELQRVEQNFPTQEHIELYTRDLNITPFSSLSALGQAKEKLTSDPILREIFPHTSSIFDVLTHGFSNIINIEHIYRHDKYLAYYYLNTRETIESEKYFEKLANENQEYDRIKMLSYASLCALHNNDITKSLDILTSAYIENNKTPTIFPIPELIDKLNNPTQWPNTISLPILFRLYNNYYETEESPNLPFSFESFQLINKINLPSDWNKLSDRFSLPSIIYYLQHVWTTEVMKKTLLYSSTKEIEEVRINICQLLIELNPENSVEYKEEIKERAKQLEIAKGTSLLEQSKVYVDIEAIKKTLRNRIKDPYARYKTLAATQKLTHREIYKGFNDFVIEWTEKEGKFAPLFIQNMRIINSLPEISESDIQFQSIFSEVVHEFLRGDHGLNAYLSTTVRHGILSKALREVVLQEKLVTPKEEGKDVYIRNKHWKSYPDISIETPTQWEEILDKLEEFTRKYDDVIVHVKDKLLQINLINSRTESSNSDGLFIYSTTSSERKAVQKLDILNKSTDDLVDTCVDFLWEKTDKNLLNVRNVLDTNVRYMFNKLFDDLSDFLKSRSEVNGIHELINAVGRAKTQSNSKLTQVISWFKRSQVYDRQDYSPAYAFDVALNMIKKTTPHASKWNGAKIKDDIDMNLMPGRTLDGMVYMFHGLLENAILRSKVDLESLFVNINLTFNDGIYTCRFVNNISTTCLESIEKEKLESLKASLASEEAPLYAQREGRSGLSKIWTTIHSPIYKAPHLDFYQSEDLLFTVIVSFKLDVHYG